LPALSNSRGGSERLDMTRTLAWTLLVASGLLDVAWAVAVKYADGYTRFGWSIVSLVLLAAFVYLLGRSLEVLPVGTAYAVWTGVGAVGTVLLGALLFHEPLTVLRLTFIALIVGGIVGLKMSAA